MSQDHTTSFEPAEYTDLPDGRRDSPEWQAARELDARAQDAQGRLALGCCLFWLDDGGYLLTAPPPMGDVRGSATEMTIYTAEHLITIGGENLHLLAWSMKLQQVDNLAVTPTAENTEETDGGPLPQSRRRREMTNNVKGAASQI